MKALYPCQRQLVDRSVESLRRHKVWLNSSDTGVGKTLMSVEACRDLGLPGMVVCPLAVVPSWRKTFEEQGVPFIDIQGWEKLRTGKTKYGTWIGKKFIWKVRDCALIFDECQKAQTRGTKNSRMMMGARDAQLPHMMLSATAAEDISELGALGYCLRLHNDIDFVSWATSNGCVFDFWGKLRPDSCESIAHHHLANVRKQIYPEKGGRLTRADLAEHFTECSINADPMDFGPEIARIFEEEMGDELQVVDGQIKADLEKAREKARIDALKAGASIEDADEAARDAEVNPLTRILRMRQRVEVAKTVEVLNLLADYRAEHYSVAIFLNFDASIEAIKDRIKEPYSVVRGGQNPRDRAIEVENFQRNAVKIILCNTAAGGVGVNLHDEDGGHPRASIISPSYDAKVYHQVLGRIDRAGAKTPSIQRVLVAAGTIEEQILEAITYKLRNLSIFTLQENQNAATPSPTMPPETEPALVFSEENPCGTVVEVPVAELATPAVKKPRKAKAPVILVDETPAAPVPPAPLLKVYDRAVGNTDRPVEVDTLVATVEPAHAEYGPSTLKYFEIAPMYRPSKDTNPAAEMGTRIHLACETGNLDVLVDEERLIAEKMLQGMNWIIQRHKLDLSKCEDHKEIRLTMELPNGESTFGTCDRLLVSGSEGVMTDYKTGRNAVDDPEINAQTWAYVAGAFQRFPQLQRIHFYFILPQRDEVMHAVFERDKLPLMLLRISTIIARAKAATTCNPQPGVCDFCARVADCQQLRELALPIAQKYQLEGYPIPENVHASEADDPATRGKLMSLARIMDKWSTSVRHHVTDAAANGEEVDGFYLLRMKGRASILSTPGAYEVLKDTVSIDDMLLCSDLKLDKLEDLLKSRAEKGQKGKVIEMIKDRLTDAGILAEGEGSLQLRVKKEKSAPAE